MFKLGPYSYIVIAWTILVSAVLRILHDSVDDYSNPEPLYLIALTFTGTVAILFRRNREQFQPRRATVLLEFLSVAYVGLYLSRSIANAVALFLSTSSFMSEAQSFGNALPSTEWLIILTAYHGTLIVTPVLFLVAYVIAYVHSARHEQPSHTG